MLRTTSFLRVAAARRALTAPAAGRKTLVFAAFTPPIPATTTITLSSILSGRRGNANKQFQKKKSVHVRFYSAGGPSLKEEEVFGRIAELLKGFDKVTNPEKVNKEAHFANDLGLDSLDTVEVVMAIEEEFSIEIPDKDADQIHSVDAAVKYICSQPDAQ